MLGRIGAGFELAFNRGLGQQVRVGDQSVDGVDGLVQVVLERVEVAVVAVGDLWRDVAFRDAVHIACGHIQRADHGVQRVVHALHDPLEVALVLGRIGAGFELAVHRGLGQQIRVSDHGLHGRLHATHGVRQYADLVLAVHVEREFEVSGGHLVGTLDQLVRRCGDGARDEPGQQQGQQRRDYAQDHDPALGTVSEFVGVLANLFHQRGLEVVQVRHVLEISRLRVAQGALHQRDHVFLLGACPYKFQKFVLIHDVGGARGLHLAQEILALVAGDGFVQRVHVDRNLLPEVGDLLDRFLPFCAFKNVGVAQGWSDRIDVFRDIAGLHSLGELVLHQVVDIGIERRHAGIADRGDDDQQDQRDGKADPQPDSDFEVVQHGMTPD